MSQKNDDPIKPQPIRILDVFIIGPVMLAGGRALYARRPLLGGALMAFGVGTIAYNARNWFAIEAAKKREGYDGGIAQGGNGGIVPPVDGGPGGGTPWADTQALKAALAAPTKAFAHLGTVKAPNVVEVVEVAEGTEADPYVKKGAMLGPVKGEAGYYY